MSSQNSHRILIVEEESLIGWSLASALRREGYPSDVVECGEEALSRVREGSYDLIISDIRLPHMDGVDFARRVKRISGNLPVIIVTAHEDLALRDPISDIDYYLEKPFNLSEMLNLVHEIFDSAPHG